MSSTMTPDNIQAALESLESELPSLTGKDAWNTIKDEFHTLKRRLQESDDPEECDRLASELIDLLVPYEDARDRLKEETRLQHIRVVLQDTMETDLPAFAATMGMDNMIVEPSAAIVLKSMVVDPEESEVRLIKIKEGGIEGGKSIKIHNLHLNLRVMTELIASTTITGTTVITQPDPHIVVAGVLLIINSLTETVTIPLSEEETSVFWGLVLARDSDNSAEECLIVEYTNDERIKHGRQPLTNEGVRGALRRLEKLKSVEPLEGEQDTDIWRIVEKYEIS